MDVATASRVELELHYSPSRWSHRLGPDKIIQDHVNTTTKGSELARASVDCELGFSYGLGDREKVDIYGMKTLPGEAPVFIYIHGGYWQELGREMSSFMVLPLAKAGAVCAVLGYELAPKASMDEIVQQVTKGVSFIMTMAQRRGSSSVYLCGSSAGGHLVAMMLAQDWMSECMVSPSFIRGAVLVSGVFDLKPLVNTYVNDALKMSQEDAVRNSPVKLVDKIGSYSGHRHIIVAYGEHDPPEFHRQSRDMAAALVTHGIRCSVIEVPDTDHFNVIENLQNDDYVLTKECIKLMGLNIDSVLQHMENTSIS